MSKSKLKTRTITGALYGIVFISSLILGELSSSLFFLVVMLLAIKEFYALVQNEKSKPQVYLGMLISLALFASSFLYFKSFELSKISFAISCFLVLLVFILELFRKESVSYNNIGLTLMGVIYISVPMSLTLISMTLCSY
jgi:phosphatidate cytidylyltransferase